MRVNKVPLSQVATINPAPTKLTPDESVSFLGMVDVSEDGVTNEGTSRPWGEVNKGYTAFRKDDLLVAKITPCFQNGKIAQAAITHEIGAGSTEFHVVRPSREVDGRYLLHFLRQDWIRKEGELRMTGSGGQRRVPQSYLDTLPVPLPPLTEQRKIGALMDEADALYSKRRQAIALLDDLTRSIFLDMFSNGPSWPEVTVGELAENHKGSIRTGPFGSQLLHEEFTDTGIPVLGIDNAVHNEFLWGERRYISQEKYEQLKRFTVHPGDVLITIMGTCGRCAIVPNDIPTAINTKHLCCITLDQRKCLPTFLHSYFLLHPVSRSYLTRTAKGAIMSGLNMGIIKDLPVRLPPVSLQQEYEDRVKDIHSTKEFHERHLTAIGELSSSLQRRVFSDTLQDHEAAASGLTDRA